MAKSIVNGVDKKIRKGVLTVCESLGSISDNRHAYCMTRELKNRKTETLGGAKVRLSLCTPREPLRPEDYEKLKKIVEDHNAPFSLDLKKIRVDVSKSNGSTCYMCGMKLSKGELRCLYNNKYCHLACKLNDYESVEGTLQDVWKRCDVEEEFEEKAEADLQTFLNSRNS